MTGPGRILIVDDERVVRTSCRRVLEEEGYLTCEVTRGEEVLGELEREHYRAVLLDLKMPGIGGMDVLARIRERWPHLPVVIITGYATLDTKREAERQGATTWLPKPFGPPELLEALSRVL